MSATLCRGEETAFAFDCKGDDLIGFLHAGDRGCDIGVLTIVAGGPQYRGGVGRQLVNLGRYLAAKGLWVMRFDHRGVGDSAGTFRGFQAVEDDIAAAISAFKARVPHLRGVILWGGCDSATAALINAYKFPDVVCVVAGNPFVGSAGADTPMAKNHYLSRLRQGSFWRKVARGDYSVREYAAAALRRLWGKVGRANGGSKPANGADRPGFQADLLTGLREFDGKVLFLMGDRFLNSDKFNTLVASNADWQAAYSKPDYQRIDIKGGDQVFSTQAAQQRMFTAASVWIHQAFPDSFQLEKPVALQFRQPQR